MFTRSVWLLIVAPLFCVGCDMGPPPDPRQAQVVGMWRQVYQGPKGLFTLKEDGTFTATTVTPFEYKVMFRAPDMIDIKGTWSTTEGKLHFRIDEASAMQDTLVGQESVESIKDINPDWFCTIDAKNREIMYSRTDKDETTLNLIRPGMQLPSAGEKKADEDEGEGK